MRGNSVKLFAVRNRCFFFFLKKLDFQESKQKSEICLSVYAAEKIRFSFLLKNGSIKYNVACKLWLYFHLFILENCRS